MVAAYSSSPTHLSWPRYFCFPDSILSAGLEETEEDDSDPFIPQERIFSKYAAMLYTSNNQGRSFEEFKEAKFCPSCGEKVGNTENHS